VATTSTGAVGVGSISALAFPLRRRARFFEMATGADVIRQSLEQLLGSPQLSRPMLPGWGCAVHARLWEPADESLAMAARQDVIDAIEAWEPRVAVVSVDAAIDADLGILRITVNYRIIGAASLPVQSVGADFQLLGGG
jgi:phage baseplate assembly protein W